MAATCPAIVATPKPARAIRVDRASPRLHDGWYKGLACDPLACPTRELARCRQMPSSSSSRTAPPTGNWCGSRDEREVTVIRLGERRRVWKATYQANAEMVADRVDRGDYRSAERRSRPGARQRSPGRADDVRRPRHAGYDYLVDGT